MKHFAFLDLARSGLYSVKAQGRWSGPLFCLSLSYYDRYKEPGSSWDLQADDLFVMFLENGLSGPHMFLKAHDIEAVALLEPPMFYAYPGAPRRPYPRNEWFFIREER